MNFPIYIPSKGRSKTCRTPFVLMSCKIPFEIVVEPHEFDDYSLVFGAENIVMLPESNMGLWYSRQFIKSRSKDLGHLYHWQLDDDIRRFILRIPGAKSETIDATSALNEIERFVLSNSNIGQAGTDQNSWPPGPRPIKINNLPVQCVLNCNSTSATYRPSGRIEDMDYTLQTLSEGMVTALFNWIRTDTPAIGTNTGGLHDQYENHKETEHAMNRMVREFGTMSVDYDEMGPHLRRNRIWSTFKQRPIPI